MKRNPFGIETKVGASLSTGGVVSLVFGLAAFYHWFTPPPPYLSGLIVAGVSGLAGWLAPHTPRPVQSAISIEGDPSKQPAIIKFDGTVAEADIEHLKSALKGIGFGPALQPPATYSTSPTPPGHGQGYKPAGNLTPPDPAAPPLVTGPAPQEGAAP